MAAIDDAPERKPVGEIIAAAGARFFTDPLSDWSRKLLVMLLLLTSVSWLLLLGIVVPKDTDMVGTVSWNKPESAVLVAALATIYVLILYCLSSRQDIQIWKFGNNSAITSIRQRVVEVMRDIDNIHAPQVHLRAEATLLGDKLLHSESQADAQFMANYQGYDLADLSDVTEIAKVDPGTEESLNLHRQRIEKLQTHMKRLPKLEGDHERLWQIQRTLVYDEARADALFAEVVVLDQLIDDSKRHADMRQWMQVGGPAVLAIVTTVVVALTTLFAR